jgi:O-succinylbenzoic acid--CoA ligase
MRAADWLRRAARANPETVAVDDGQYSLSFAELDLRVSEVAGRLAAQGIEPGTGALLPLGEGLGKVVQIHALIRLGVTVIPVEQGLPAGEMERIREATAPDHVLEPEEGLGGSGVEPKAFEQPEGGNPVCRILTGGSTGPPTAVGLTAENHFASAVGSALNLGLERTDRWLCAVPLSHVSGFTIVMRGAIYGTGIRLADRFTPDLLARASQEDGVNTASLVPTMLARIIESGSIPDGLRFVLLGGAPVPAEMVIEASGAGIPVAPTYGLTEACSQVATAAPGIALERPDSAGLPLPGTEVTIEEGEILVRGPTVARDSVSPDGWLRTGDLGRMDEDGFLYVEGRKDRAIFSGGEKVDPDHVEAVLAAHPDVAEAAVFGVPDAEWQEAVVAAVVPADGSKPQEDALIETCGDSLARFKVPKRILVVASIPTTKAGKRDTAALVAMATRSNP